MSMAVTSYRDETAATYARAQALEVENEELRSQIANLEQQSVRLAPLEAPQAKTKLSALSVLLSVFGVAVVLALALFFRHTPPPSAVATAPSVVATPNLRSVLGTTAVNVTFENPTARAVRVYWVDYEGREIFYQELAPRTSYEQATYATHPWRVREVGTNTLVREFIANATPTRVRTSPQ